MENTLEQVFRENERFLWGLSYRLTGNAADADDIVQETFIRAMKHPPARTDEPWRPWLVTVAMNLGRDLLRKRKRRAYEGPWLPSPIDTGEEVSPPSHEPEDEEGNPLARYDMLESVSFAFLLALEALSPSQRAVLLLRDVFDYSVRETSEALAITEANVKTTHTRARRAMRDYDRARVPPTAFVQRRTREMIEKFLTCLANHDVATAEAMLANDARHTTDGGGRYIAARIPILGPRKIVTFFMHVLASGASSRTHSWRMLNGLPALVAEHPGNDPNYAPRSVTICRLNTNGDIVAIHSIVAPEKLLKVF